MMKSEVGKLLEIIGNTACREVIANADIADRIYSAGIKEYGSVKISLSSVYQAGKLEGIRQERERRKRVC